MAVKNEGAAEAVVEFVREAVDLLNAQGTPRRPVAVDEWVREGDSFVRRERSRSYVDTFSLREDLHALPSFERAVRAFQDDDRMASRFGPLAGTAIGFDRLSPEDILDHILREALDRSEGGAEITADEDFAREQYALIAEALYSDEVAYRVVAPIHGLKIPDLPVELESGVVIDALTDSEIVRCLRSGLLRPLGDFPAVRVGTLVGLRIDRGLRRRAIVEGEPPPADLSTEAMAFYDSATAQVDRAIQALRLLRPGTTGTSGVVYFPSNPLYEGSTGWIPVATSLRMQFARFELDAGDVARLRELWEALSDAGVERQKTLPIALRRFMYAGDRDRPDDQLIDLVIALEAVFLAGERQELGFKLALRGAFFLKDERKNFAETFALLKRAYDARSALVHGSTLRDLKLPDGAHVSLDEFVEATAELTRLVLRRAVRIAAGSEPGSLADFDAAVFDS